MFAEFARRPTGWRNDIIIRGNSRCFGGFVSWKWVGGQLSRIMNGCWWRGAVIEGDNCRGNLWIVKYRVVDF